MANPPLRFSEWYEVNGYPLATFGYAIESVSAGMPAKRGQNIVAPQLHGQIFQQKRLDSRTETWTMWVCDANPTTGVVPTTNAEKNQQFIDNMRTVNQILGDNGDTLTVKKIWDTGLAGGITNIERNGTTDIATLTLDGNYGIKVGDTISVTMNNATYSSFNCYGAVVTAVNNTPPVTISYSNDGATVSSTAATGTVGVFKTLEAEAENISAIQVSDWKTLKYSTFNVEMLFPDPRWYDIHTSTSGAEFTNNASQAATFFAGSAPVTKMTIQFAPSSGPQTLHGPIKIANTTYPTMEIGYNIDIVYPATITIDTEDLTVVDGSSVNKVENLYRNGTSRDWFAIYPNQSNIITFTTDANSTGSVFITYKKAYFI